jgi:hypothetical protein
MTATYCGDLGPVNLEPERNCSLWRRGPSWRLVIAAIGSLPVTYDISRVCN